MTSQPNRRDMLRTAGAALAAGATLGACQGVASDATGKRPNVLFLMTDQQTLRAISAGGNPSLQTPNMDALAADGARFEKSYCTSPVCGPSRSSLITGRMPHETGVNVNGQSIHRSIPNFGQVFRAAGYETAWTGKWHLPGSYPRADSLAGFRHLQVKSTNYAMGGATDDAVADRAVEFLEADHRGPFLLAVSLHNPHDICHWTGKRPVQYGPGHPDVGAFPPLPANFAVDPSEPEFIRDCRRRTEYGPENGHTRNWDDVQWRAYLRAYYDYTQQVDATLGRVLDALGRRGLEENTLIVFTSDHGEGCAAHHWVVKLMLYDEPAGVPMIVSFPGRVPRGLVDRTHLVSGIDVLPTLCDYANVAIPDGLRGESLRPLIETPDVAGREFLVCELQPFPSQPRRRGRMVRTARFKYIVFSDGARAEMLFDMDSDPGETRNLAGEADHRDELIRHRKLLAGWVEETADEFDGVK